MAPADLPERGPRPDPSPRGQGDAWPVAKAQALRAKPWKSTAELRKFGLVMAAPLAVIGALLVWKGRPTATYVFALAALFALLGMAAPRLLAPVERAWMALAAVLATVMTHVVLTLTFALLITPMGLVMRLLRKDPLQRKRDPERSTFWVPVEPDGPCSRPDKPF
jgi:hypothetical protein